MTVVDNFKTVGEVEVDRRRRISLGKIGRPEHTRYIVAEAADGEIRLIPAVMIPEREMIIWQDAALRTDLLEGIADATAGRVRPAGDLSEYLAADDDDDADDGVSTYSIYFTAKDSDAVPTSADAEYT